MTTTKAKPETFTPAQNPDGEDGHRPYLIYRATNARGWTLSVVKFDEEPHVAVLFPAANGVLGTPDCPAVYEPPLLGVGLDSYPGLRVPAYVRKEAERMLEEARSWGGGGDEA